MIAAHFDQKKNQCARECHCVPHAVWEMIFLWVWSIPKSHLATCLTLPTSFSCFLCTANCHFMSLWSTELVAEQPPLPRLHWFRPFVHTQSFPSSLILIRCCLSHASSTSQSLQPHTTICLRPARPLSHYHTVFLLRSDTNRWLRHRQPLRPHPYDLSICFLMPSISTDIWKHPVASLLVGSRTSLQQSQHIDRLGLSLGLCVLRGISLSHEDATLCCRSCKQLLV